MKIVFMGTSDFAVPTLKSLVRNGYMPSLIITQPDRPKGRGRKVLPPPIKAVALKLNSDLKIIQPESMKGKDCYEQIAKISPDIFVVVAFGHILKESILNLASMGAINVHASLLPKYRGPAPIQWAILNREKETGVTTIFMDEGLDTGNIIYMVKTEIFSDDTSASLHDRLSILGADLLIKTLKGVENNKLKPISQNHKQASYAPLLKKKDGLINWNSSAKSLEAFIRGMNPWPGAFTFLRDKRLKIFKSKIVSKEEYRSPGTIIKRTFDKLLVSTKKGVISILEVQSASGKKLKIKDFLAGSSMEEGMILK
mmetsp:Transcript_5222/g.2989  ORF Transcript_5222/g.2989 Transcript_5222/m.2989 type:complete len:312 (+) Transcript_5222:253-1188(+)